MYLIDVDIYVYIYNISKPFAGNINDFCLLWVIPS